MPFKLAHLADKTGWGTGGWGAVVERKRKEAHRLGTIPRCQERHGYDRETAKGQILYDSGQTFDATPVWFIRCGILWRKCTLIRTISTHLFSVESGEPICQGWSLSQCDWSCPTGMLDLNHVK